MSGKEDDDSSLVERFKTGDEAALEELIELHNEGLFRFIYWHLQDAHEASDVLSQTFYRAYSKRHRYRVRSDAKFQTWLYAIAANLCRDHLRKRKRRPGDFAAVLQESNLENDGRLALEAAPDEEASLSEEIARLHQAISTLPPPLRDALILFALEGHSQAETAKKLGCTVRAVESRVRRAKRFLALKMTKES
tara:strand:+ start:10528 stop:11106 length:579 start_codon:yes stop_codon:yes gene_type:complete